MGSPVRSSARGVAGKAMAWLPARAKGSVTPPPFAPERVHRDCLIYGHFMPSAIATL